MKCDTFYSWCVVATERIRFGPDRKAVAKELDAHLQDCRDALMEQGMDEKEATQKALESMGSAEEVAFRFAVIYRPFWGYVLRVSQILLAVLLCLCIIPLWKYAADLKLADEPNQYHSFDVYDEASYGSDTGRTLHHLSQPDVSFSADGSTFTLTDAAVYTEYSDHYGRDRTYLYVQIRQRSLLPWTEQDGYFTHFAVTGWFSARDSLGNIYTGFLDDHSGDDHFIYPSGAQTGVFTYTHECWINDFPAEAEWVEVCYERDGRSCSLYIDLTGGAGK